MRLAKDLSDDAIAEGFVAQHDIFKRGDLALRVTGLFEQLEHGSVCLLDGRWGTGKSTFIKQWAAELRLRNLPSVYFDAFSADYLESPFEAVAGTFIQAAREAQRTDQPAYKEFLSKAAAVGKSIAAVSAKLGIKVATLGAVSATDLEPLSEIRDSLADGLGDVTKEGVKRLLESHADRQTQLNELRESLKSLPTLLRPNQFGSESVPLIVFIDELDRCRPDFALGIVEVLKHLFRADGIHFVLATNRKHLELSVAERYGVGAASAEYLEKFYDFVIFFESSYERHGEGSVEAFVTATLEGFSVVESFDTRDVRDYIRAISLAFRLSLRQIQSLSINVMLSYLAVRDREFRPTVLISFLALLKTIRPDMYRQAKSGSLRWNDVKELLVGIEWGQFDINRVLSVFRFHIDNNIDVNAQEWRSFSQSLFSRLLKKSVASRFGT